MTIQKTRPTAKLQPIPTNAGGRSLAAPPKALQENLTPTDLFYVRPSQEHTAEDVATRRSGSTPRGMATAWGGSAGRPGGVDHQG